VSGEVQRAVVRRRVAGARADRRNGIDLELQLPQPHEQRWRVLLQVYMDCRRA
jgi:hypothetical protein